MHKVEQVPSLKSVRNGIFTVKSQATGQHRTFRIRKDDERGISWVSLLTGTDNTSDYTSFALVSDDGSVKCFRKLHGTQFEALANFLTNLQNHVDAEKVEVFHSGKCLICNRTLTTPESIKTGIGPVCADGNF